MAGHKYFDDLVKRLKKLGYAMTEERANRGNSVVLVAGDGHRVTVSIAIAEAPARAILREVEERRGTGSRAPKRNVRAVKQRQAAERDQLRAEAERLERARQQILSQRDQLLDGAASYLTNAEIRDLERRVQEIERQQREIEALMTERPNTGRSTVKHRSGER